MKNLLLLSDSYFQYIREEIEDFKANSASENILGGLKPTTEQLDALGCTKSWRQRIHQSASHSIDRIDRKGTRQLEQSSQREIPVHWTRFSSACLSSGLREDTFPRVFRGRPFFQHRYLDRGIYRLEIGPLPRNCPAKYRTRLLSVEDLEYLIKRFFRWFFTTLDKQV